MSINKDELTKEQIQKAMACETAEELMALAKAEGIELTKEEAEAYMAEFDDMVPSYHPMFPSISIKQMIIFLFFREILKCRLTKMN